MGMAASQARYLGLTARKTNVEYEGQQINQARTALANQSAETFNQLLELEVPTAPSTTDFTKVQYSYTDGFNNEAITDMAELINDPDGYNYMVTHYHYADIYTGVQSQRPNPQVIIETVPTDIDTNGNGIHDQGDVITIPKYVGNCEVSKYDATDSIQKAALEQIKKDFPNEAITTTKDEDIYTWIYQGKTYFATYNDLVASANSAQDPTKPTELQDKLTQYNAENVRTKIEQQQRAMVDIDNEGRPYSIRYEDSTATYALNTETVTDDKAYQDAMNKYTYEKDVYEKKIADINAKTEKIQEQDRTLELRLRQLDTEQDALQTEMEAVKKVIEKNIESTFKTFE